MISHYRFLFRILFEAPLFLNMRKASHFESVALILYNIKVAIYIKTKYLSIVQFCYLSGWFVSQSVTEVYLKHILFQKLAS